MLKPAALFDLDQTIVDTRKLESLRQKRNWRAVYRMIPSSVKVYPFIYDIFGYLKSKEIPVGIVTSSPSSYCYRILTAFGFNVDVVVGYHDSPLKKPHPQPLELALQKIGASKNNSFYAGDGIEDMMSAKRAGIMAIACLWGSSIREKALEEIRPDYIFYDTKSFLKWLKKRY